MSTMEYDLSQNKRLQHRMFQDMDQHIYFEYMLCSLYIQNFQYILVDNYRRDFHDSLQHIHKLRMSSRRDILHLHHMVMGSKDQKLLVVLLEELFKLKRKKNV